MREELRTKLDNIGATTSGSADVVEDPHGCKREVKALASNIDNQKTQKASKCLYRSLARRCR